MDWPRPGRHMQTLWVLFRIRGRQPRGRPNAQQETDNVPLIALTRLHLRSARYLPQFYWHVVGSWLQARRASGCLGVRLLREADNTFWTSTGWQDDAAMKAFMLRGSHRSAMPKLKRWCDEASVAQWHQDRAELPDWIEAHRRMVQDGRPSRVNDPSAAHIAFKIPRPRV